MVVPVHTIYSPGSNNARNPEGARLFVAWLTAHEGSRRPIDPAIEMYRTRGIEKREGRSDTYFRGKATQVLKTGVLKY